MILKELSTFSKACYDELHGNQLANGFREWF